MTFIVWCNDNQGFVTACFSILSLLISSIAIVISIKTAKLPFRKSIRISSGSYIGVGEGMDDEHGVYVNALNIGNVPIHISEVGLLHRKKKLININTISSARGVLKQMEDVEQRFSSIELKEKLRGKKGRVYAFAQDAEGRVYKKYLCKASDF